MQEVDLFESYTNLDELYEVLEEIISKGYEIKAFDIVPKQGTFLGCYSLMIVYEKIVEE